jgi:hypothetical protein
MADALFVLEITSNILLGIKTKIYPKHLVRVGSYSQSGQFDRTHNNLTFSNFYTSPLGTRLPL